MLLVTLQEFPDSHLTISSKTFTPELLPGVSYSSAQALESSIRQFITSRELALYRMMSFQLGWVDEHGEPSPVPTRPRLHGQFAIATASAIAGSSGSSDELAERVIPYAVSLELLQNYSLIHEDVEDGNTEHNGRPSVWWTWGPAQAINAGDGMHAMARMALFALSESGESVETVSGALKSLDMAAVQMCEGEYIDITMQEQIALNSASYVEMVSMRSGALFGAAAGMAALAIGRPELAEGLVEYGRLTGTARQLAMDYLLFWGEPGIDSVQQGRLLTKKKNLPVVLAIEHAPPGIKRQIGEIYMQRVIDPKRVDGLVELLDEIDCRQQVLERVGQQLTAAQDALSDLEITDEAKQRLGAVAASMVGTGAGSESEPADENDRENA